MEIPCELVLADVNPVKLMQNSLTRRTTENDAFHQSTSEIRQPIKLFFMLSVLRLIFM